MSGVMVRAGRWLGGVAIALACACASSPDVPPDPAILAASGPVRDDWESAESAYDRGDYTEAVRRFNLLRAKYPYSELATLADLRIADAYFAQAKYATAAEQYRAFMKLHAEDERVPYAAWRVALAFYEQMPSDFFALPPAYERDLGRARDAERELALYIRLYPESEYRAEAERYLARTKRRLADHELYVAEYYIDRDNPRAAAARASYLLKRYAGLGLDARALFLLGRAYIELGDVEKASTALADLVRYHGSDPLAARARAWASEHGIALDAAPRGG